MSTLQRIHFFGSLFVIFILFSKAEASPAESIVLNIKYNVSVPVNLKKYGVNGALLGSKMSYGSDLLVRVYNEIGVTFTRFPGGTVGNYYNWSTGTFLCDKRSVGRSIKRIERMNRTLKRTGGTYSVDDFFSFVNATNTDFTYVLNILCDSEESNTKLLKYIKSKNIELKFVELGNEMYSNEYSWVYKDAQSYLKRVERNYKAIKSVYPNAKIGLIVTPISYSGKSDPQPGGIPRKSWPKKLRDYDTLSANSLFSDALIIHIYGHPYTNKWFKFDPATHEEHFLTVIDHFNHKFDTSMQYLQALGHNKPVWITEWGISAPANRRMGLFREYKKSAFHALYVASVLSAITLEKNVEVANYHIIGDLWNSTKNGYKISPVGEVMDMFLGIANSSDIIYSITVDRQMSGVKALMFSGDKGEEIIVINENNKKYSLNKILTNNNISDYKVESMTVSSDGLKFDNSINNYNLKTASIEIKPYSILRIRRISPN